MAAIYETAYPRFKQYFTAKELSEVFTLSPDEQALLNKKTKTQNNISRLGFSLLLKSYQYLGRPIRVNEINLCVKKYVAKQISINIEIDLMDYPKETFKRHKKIISEYLEINLDKQKRRALMKKSALDAATTKENLADIINRIIEELFHQRFELPAYQSLVRLSRAARTVTNYKAYRKISEALSALQKQTINTILEKNDGDAEKDWSWFDLKQEPKSPTPNNMRRFIAYVYRLKQLREELFVDVDFIAPTRLEYLRDEAMITDQADMRKLGELKRYALVVILIYMKVTTGMDDLIHVLTVWIKKIENKDKEKYQNYQLEQAEKTNELILSLYQMLLVIEKNDTPQDKINAIENQLGGKLSKLIEACREHLGLTRDKHYGWMLIPYNNKRITSIVDVMIDVERWLNLSVFFKPLSGNESKIADYSPRFVATALSYGCNMGPTQTERCLTQFSRKQIAWLFHHHATEQRLIKSCSHLINSYNLFDLPKQWGPGDSASVDGTFWDMYSQNLLAAHHIRYGRYGGVGYYHVSDQYIALFSNFISLSVHESIYLLTGVIENDSDMKINKVYGDSWAQSEVLFGLSFLMAIAIMPRIKRFKHLFYYKAAQLHKRS